MNPTSYQHGQLHIEQTAVAELAKQFGTPFYAYSKGALEQAFLAYRDSLTEIEALVCYAVKANSNLAVLQTLARLGAGFDIVSIGELERVIAAGGSPSKVVFSGVGKTAQEMQRALEVDVHCFNVESEAELDLLAKVAQGLGKSARVSLRVNPDVDPKTHPYISTGLKENKFGVDFSQAPKIYQKAHELDGIEVVGIDCHIGSQLTELEPFMDALDRVLALIDQLRGQGINLKHIDMGGGLGINYSGNDTPPSIPSYIKALSTRLKNTGLSLVLEPGRSIAASAGILVTEVLFLKPAEHKNFAVVDAAMNDNIRPSLYQAWQNIVPVVEPATDSKNKVQTWDIVGPICEAGDFLAKERQLDLCQGDLLAMLDSGAYGFGMASNYNSRPRVCEIMVEDNRYWLVRERENFTDMIRGEHLLP